MSFGGSVAAMITSLKMNSRPKRKFKGRTVDVTNHLKNIALKFDDIPEVELKKIKLKIREEYRAERKKKIVFSAILIMFLLLGFGVAFISFYNHTQDDISVHRKQKIENQKLLKSKMLSYMALGDSSLVVEDYGLAKKYLGDAYLIDSENEQIFIVRTKAYIFDCLKNGVECSMCDYYVNQLRQKHGDEYILKKIGSIYDEYRLKKEKELQERNDNITKLLNRGYRYLSKKDFAKAEYYIFEAYHLDEENYNSNIALLSIYVWKCIENGVGCNLAEQKIMNIENKYGVTFELKSLVDLYESK